MVNIVIIEVAKANQIAGTMWQIIDVRKIKYDTFTTIFLRETKPEFSSTWRDFFQS